MNAPGSSIPGTFTIDLASATPTGTPDGTCNGQGAQNVVSVSTSADGGYLVTYTKAGGSSTTWEIAASYQDLNILGTECDDAVTIISTPDTPGSINVDLKAGSDVVTIGGGGGKYSSTPIVADATRFVEAFSFQLNHLVKLASHCFRTTPSLHFRRL